MHTVRNTVTYDPELFPGLILRINKVNRPNIVMLVFHTGKLVITGAKKREDIYQAFEDTKHLLYDHRKEPDVSNLPSYVEQVKAIKN